MKKIVYLICCIVICISCKKEPLAEFEISGTTKVGEKILFLNHSVNSNTYDWDFGDGSTSTEEGPSHIYSKPGDYKISLKATGDNGFSMVDKQIKITGTTFSIKNNSSFDFTFFCTFYWTGTEIFDYLPLGALFKGAETDVVITTRPEIMFGLEMSDIIFIGGPMSVTQDIHNSLFIDDNTQVYTDGKGLENIFAKLRNEINKQ